MKNYLRRFNKGVAAIEFALVFPVLFIILYGLVTYSLIFAIQHSLSMAAAEGGRAAVKYQSNDDTMDMRINAACEEARKNLSWVARFGLFLDCSSNGNNNSAAILSAKFLPITCQFQSSNATTQCLDLKLVYKYSSQPLLPIFILPVPNELTGSSFTQFSLSF